MTQTQKQHTELTALLTSAENLKNKLSELSAMLLFDLGIKDERFEKVMWAKNSLKYSGDLRQAVSDGWRIYGEVKAGLVAPPVMVTVHEII
jgi:hypothetical protein